MTLLPFIRTNARWLLAGGLLTFSSSFGQTFFISIFAGRITDAYRLTDGQWGSVYGLGTMASGFLMLWAGGLVDRFRARDIASVMMGALACMCLAMAISRNAALLVAIIFGLRFCGQGMLSHIATVAMARWFTAARGRALALASLGFSLGEAALPLTFAALLLLFPWTALWAIAALLVLALIPVIRRLLREERTPRALAQEEGTRGMGGRHWTRGQALRHWLFWAVMPLAIAPPMLSTAFFFQQVHFAASKGWPLIHLVALFPAFTVTVVLSAMAYGIAVDRWGSVRILPLFQLPMAAAFLIWGASTELWQVLVGLVLMGTMQGGNSVVPAAFWTEVYGTRHLGSIKALVAAEMVLGSAIGPAVTGALIDRGMPFQDQMPWIAGFVVAACALSFSAVTVARRKMLPPVNASA